MVKVCERHICFLRRGTTYEWVSQQDCDLCNLESLPEQRAVYVYNQIEASHICTNIRPLPKTKSKCPRNYKLNPSLKSCKPCGYYVFCPVLYSLIQNDKHLNKPQYIKLNAEQTKTKEE